jgi:penicillin-binding protein 1A
VDKASAAIRFGTHRASILPADIAWTGHRAPAEILSVGNLVYVRVAALSPGRRGTRAPEAARVTLEQFSGIQGALLALDNLTGDVKAMVGGRDFEQSKFNRATQALRQVGSSFKPYVYAAAIEEGASPDDTILDAPVTFTTASGPYRPRNYDGRYAGPVTLRQALAQSRNIPALRLAQRVGIAKIIDYTRRFGITSDLPPFLPLALGAAEITLMEQTAAFATFPNEGVHVTPRFIRKVTDAQGNVLEENYPEVSDGIRPRSARMMTSLLRHVVLQGTATSARRLNHPLGGKTGTTNDYTDAWFIGFSPSITCGTWVGFDEKKSMGTGETGGAAALPIWIEFMKAAIRGREGESFTDPSLEPRQNVATLSGGAKRAQPSP